MDDDNENTGMPQTRNATDGQEEQLHAQRVSRRRFLRNTGLGLGGVAAAGIVGKPIGEHVAKRAEQKVLDNWKDGAQMYDGPYNTAAMDEVAAVMRGHLSKVQDKFTPGQLAELRYDYDISYRNPGFLHDFTPEQQRLVSKLNIAFKDARRIVIQRHIELNDNGTSPDIKRGGKNGAALFALPAFGAAAYAAARSVDERSPSVDTPHTPEAQERESSRSPLSRRRFLQKATLGAAGVAATAVGAKFGADLAKGHERNELESWRNGHSITEYKDVGLLSPHNDDSTFQPDAARLNEEIDAAIEQERKKLPAQYGDRTSQQETEYWEGIPKRVRSETIKRHLENNERGNSPAVIKGAIEGGLVTATAPITVPFAGPAAVVVGRSLGQGLMLVAGGVTGGGDGGQD